MKMCRFRNHQGTICIGFMEPNDTITDLSPLGVSALEQVLESENLPNRLSALREQNPARIPVGDVQLLSPVEHQEIWAAGVTYLRSKKARMEESDFSATAYDRVYEAERPELFFKALPEKVAGPGEPVGIRRDANWSVPEPELALVLNSKGTVVGYTIGNDMSSRDIEGENLLYLPQAKIYRGSCALGPAIALGCPESEAREWRIRLNILRGAKPVFVGETSVNQIKRSFGDLAEYLFRSQQFPHGAVLLTGTGIVPPDGFTLQPGDVVEIEVTGIGLLRNTVEVV